MPNYCTETFSLFSKDAGRLRSLKQKAATSKVTPCLRSTNNIIVLNASCLIAVSITFLSELLQTRSASYMTIPHSSALGTRRFRLRKCFTTNFSATETHSGRKRIVFENKSTETSCEKIHVLYVLNCAVSSCFISQSINNPFNLNTQLNAQ